MKVRLLFFSVLRDVTNTDEIVLEMAEGATVADLLEQVFARWPGLKAWDANLLIALDQTYVKRDAALHENAEVALMPPVQGG
jgi:molybdopterin converting factor subunit 1